LERQPKSLREAVATAERLEREGFRFSVGIGQLLVTNMRALGLSYAQAFEPCRNLQAISELMVKNYTKALTANPNPQEALRDSLSMYYSGNPVRGYRPDKEGDLSYVQKVVVGALNPSSADPIVPAVEATAGDEAIPVAVASPGARKTPVRARTASSKHSDPWVKTARHRNPLNRLRCNRRALSSQGFKLRWTLAMLRRLNSSNASLIPNQPLRWHPAKGKRKSSHLSYRSSIEFLAREKRGIYAKTSIRFFAGSVIAVRSSRC
jgi:hypothetical protein